MWEIVHPWVLTGLLIVVLLHWIFSRRRLPSVVVPTIRPALSLRRKWKKSCFEISLLLALTLLIFALARPRRAAGERTFRARGLDIVLALDLSGSMKIIDRPEEMTEKEFLDGVSSGAVPERLAAAKKELRRFVESRPNDRIGLIGFADLAYSFVPPTLDHSLLLNRLETLEAGEIGERTGIASPIGIGVERLKRSPAPRRVLVLFTDGANNIQNALTPEQAALLAKEFQVILHTVGVGSDNTYVIGETPFGPRLQKVDGGEFDAQLLQKLASLTGGSYFHAADADGLRRTMEEINQLERTNVEEPRPLEYQEFSPFLALLALGVLCFGLIADNTWQLHLP